MKAKIYTDGRFLVGGFKKEKWMKDFTILEYVNLSNENKLELQEYGFTKYKGVKIFNDLSHENNILFNGMFDNINKKYEIK